MVEPTLAWVRSTFCADSSCVEVARVGADVAMRDSKNVEQPFLLFSDEEWTAFIDEITAGKYRSF